MTLQEVLQVIGAIGVISSFTYAAIQVRRNTRALRAATYQQLATSIVTSWDDLAKNAELCDLILRASDNFEPLGRVEKARFRFSMMGYLRRYETAYFQHKIGVLKEGDWAGISADMDALFPLPGVRAVWPLIRNRSNAEFRAYVDALIERLPVQSA